MFIEVPSNESFKNYAISARVDSKTYAPGSAWKKQLAKESASKNALKVLLMEYYSSLGDNGKVSRLTNMDENDEKISREVDHPTRYKPQPKVVVNKMGFHMLEAKQMTVEDQKGVFYKVIISSIHFWLNFLCLCFAMKISWAEISCVHF